MAERRRPGDAETASGPAPAGGARAPRARGAAPAGRWLRRFLLLLGPLAVAAAGGYVYLTGGRYVATEDAYLEADKVMVASEVPGVIDAVEVRENQPVARGDVLFRIDDRPYRLALAEAEARLAGARDEIAGLRASYRQKQAELALARTDADFAGREFRRQSRLAAGHNTSRSRLDAARHALDAARQRVGIIAQELAGIRARLGGDPDAPVERHPRYLEAEAARDRAALDLERTVVRAPFAGIASHTPERGRQVPGNGPLSSPVMSIVADTGVWIEADFKETDLTHVRAGQPVRVWVDTYPGRTWRGSVESIGQATGAEFSVIPPQNATGNWVKVVQRIPVRIAVDAGGDDPALRVGMSATVEIDTGHRRRLPELVRAALSWLGISHPARAAEAGTPR